MAQLAPSLPHWMSYDQHFVVIDIGGNDLSRGISPLNIAVAILVDLDMAHDILSNTANNAFSALKQCWVSTIKHIIAYL